MTAAATQRRQRLSRESSERGRIATSEQCRCRSRQGEKAEKAVALSPHRVCCRQNRQEERQYRIEKERRGTRGRTRTRTTPGSLLMLRRTEEISLRHGVAAAVTTHSAASPSLHQPATFLSLSLLLLRSIPCSLFPTNLMAFACKAMLRTLNFRDTYTIE